MSSRTRPISGFRTADADRRPGRRRVPSLLATTLFLVVAGQGCVYSFTAGSFPSHVKTIAIVPFENSTTRLELTQEIHAALLRDLPRSLGIRPGGEDMADAVVRGTITAYDLSTPNYRAGEGDRAQVLQRQVSIVVSVEIVDLVNNQILWENRSVRGEGQYLEASQGEDDAKVVAIDNLIKRIVDGAQSNW